MTSPSALMRLYDESQQLSITRMEYRRAYEILHSGRIKLITFVREELWNVREDRKALEAFLKDDRKTRDEIDEAEIKSIVHHRSTFLNDAQTTFDFLKEIGRNEEMKRAMAGKGSFPVGNWIHVFSTFDDILQALRVEFGISESLSRIALKVNLKRELLSNLIILSFKSDKLTKGRIEPITFFAQLARQYFKGGFDDSTTMPGKHFNLFVLLYLAISGGGLRLSTQFIDRAITSGEFLEYDIALDQYGSGLINDGLVHLRHNIDRLKNEIRSVEKSKVSFLNKVQKLDTSETQPVTISNLDLVVPFAMYDCHQNVIDLSGALVRALDGDTATLSEVALRPTTPIEEEAEAIQKETILVEEIEGWIKAGKTGPSDG